MALAALLTGTVAGITAFASALTLGHTFGIASFAWWAVGTLVTLWPLAAILLWPRDDDLAGGFTA